MIYVVLIEPKLKENIGFIARAMKNFGLRNLYLINPKCDIKEIKTAKHASDIIKKAKTISLYDLNEFDYIIGTTAKIGRDYNINRVPLKPKDLKLPNKKIAILFGREDSGLNNKEIEMCDFIVTIPTSNKYGSMNISHAAAIIFYELFKNKKNISSHIKFADKKDKDALLKQIKLILNKMDFSSKSKKETQIKVWNRFIGKAFLTKREIFALFGFFKKLNKKGN
jgi:TrmH family RNA methyltransferase